MSPVEIMRELEKDTITPGYRGAMLAFIRFLEVSLSNDLVRVGWELKSNRKRGSRKDSEAFMEYAYTVLWPKVSAPDRERLAKEAIAISETE